MTTGSSKNKAPGVVHEDFASEPSRFERNKDFLDKCDRRVKDLTAAYEGFRDKLFSQQPQNHRNGLFLNVAVLREAVERYFLDLALERLQHRCGLLNGYRQAAFTVKWLLKLRPIQTGTQLTDHLLANEKFAFSVALTMLHIDPASIDPYFHEFFTYSLRFDSLDEGLLMSLFLQMNPNLRKVQSPSE